MSAAVPPPELDVPESWQLVSEETSTPFDVRVVTVTATTRIYEDTELRERLRPTQPPSRALSRLVSDRSSSAFVDVLEERGFSDIDRADTHRFGVDGDEVDATRYRARARFDDRSIPVEAYFAAWPSTDEYLLGGGAYPLSLPGSASFDRNEGRDDLLAVMRSIR